MNNGVLIFGHNSEGLDYVKLSSFSARLVRKNLSMPVSLITDANSLNCTNADLSVFDQILVDEKLRPLNTRLLNGKVVEFKNTNRSSAYNLSPYDRTLLIDSDLLLFSNFLNNYWNHNSDFLICEGMITIGENENLLDRVVARNSIPSVYATAIMFSKTERVKKLFELVDYIKENWKYFFDIYGMSATSFRNDFAFSIANHILNGFKDPDVLIPKILMTGYNTKVEFLDTEKITINVSGKIVELTNTDLHVWDKFSLLECLQHE